MPAGNVLESPKSPKSGKHIGITVSLKVASDFNLKSATSNDFFGWLGFS